MVCSILSTAFAASKEENRISNYVMKNTKPAMFIKGFLDPLE